MPSVELLPPKEEVEFGNREMVKKPSWMFSTVDTKVKVVGDITKKRIANMKKPVKFCMAATSTKNIDKVIKAINGKYQSQIHEKTIEIQKHKEMPKLKSDQKEIIQALENRFEIIVQVDNKQGKIKILGPAKVVTDVSEEINKIFHNVLEEERENNMAKMLARNAKWQYYKGGRWENYPVQINATIERERLEGKPFAQWEENRGSKKVTVRLDFQKKMEYVIGDDTQQMKVQQALENDILKALPPTWTPMNDGENVRVERVGYHKNAAEYKAVQDSFVQSMKQGSAAKFNKIIEIQRVQNPLLYSNYIVHKDSMTKANKGSTNPVERTLWHATGQETLNEINTNNFNRNFAGVKHGTRFGQGVYFATHASFAYGYAKPDSKNQKYMYKAKVLTGNYTVGAHNMLVPPPLNANNQAVKYNSVVDNTSDPGQWVVFYDSQCYPEYIITFT